ncbi:TIGR03435 family protein [Acidipila sp. EB88]|uniref:TIGR03435 family protein n=1 Tax=Acidipila sp. EB88 TaxID=2305226 RepID=UPI000F5DCF19|nr:TIGR03435 family protein [Acidipila sp. EB88]RRA48649.1 TIGR03435 family protein [Acidipila sp. EB88]
MYTPSKVIRSLALISSLMLMWVSLPTGRAQQSEAINPATYAKFEVASVKPGRPGGYRSFRIEPGTFSMTGVTVKDLLAYAYGVRPDQVQGGPSWVTTNLYDIMARESRESVAHIHLLTPPKRVQELHEMARSLLADRFGVAVKSEWRVLPVYSLLIAQGGPRLAPSDPLTAADGGTVRVEPNMIDLKGQTLGVLATELAERFGREVQDNTHLNGKYDIHLQWSVDEAPGSAVEQPGGRSDAQDGQSSGSSSLSIWSALKEELGLRLEKTRAPVNDIFIVDARLPNAD